MTVDAAAERQPTAVDWDNPRHVPGEAGLWVMILGDMTVFGVFFAVFTHDRTKQWDVFTAAQRSLNPYIGLANTGLLLLSSLLVVLAVKSVRHDDPARAPRLFGFAFLCGVGFAANKVIEYAHLLSSGHTPADNDFFMYYFVLTGIHAAHLVVGMFLLTFLWFATRKPRASSRMALIEGCATYWHLVDVLWIALFPLLYLA